jgi:hypothetical protein
MPDLEITGIEVTQAIQCYGGATSWHCPQSDGSVALIKNKLTVVRVYVQLNAAAAVDQQDGVTGSLWIEGLTKSIPPAGNNDPIVVKKKVGRQATWDSLNFLVPFDAVSTNRLRIRAEVRYKDGSRDPDPSDNVWPSVTGWHEESLRAMPVLQVGYLPIEVITYTVRYPPTESLIPSYPELAITLLPAQSISVARYSTVKWWRTHLDGEISEDLISRLRAVYPLYEEANGRDRIDQLVGWVNPTVMAPITGRSDPIWPTNPRGTGKVAVVALHSFGQGRQVTLAHEIGHNFDLRHAILGPKEAGYDPASPWVKDGITKNSIAEVGFDPVAMSARDPDLYRDLMSYASLRWPSPYSYRTMMNNIAARVPLARTAQAESQSSTTYVIVRGVVRPSGATWIAPLERVDLNNPVALPPGSDYCLALRDSLGTILDTACFGISWVDYETGQAKESASFVASLPNNPLATQVVLFKGNEILGRLDASTHPPIVKVITPNGGAIASNVRVTWIGSDLDGDSLTYSLYFSPDGGASWQPLAMNSPLAEDEVDTTLLRGTNNGRFRVTVSDGFNTAQDESDAPLTLLAKAPLVTISSPEANARVKPATTLVLVGSAYDVEDGPLPDTSLVWASDQDGPLGVGGTLVWEDGLSPGPHHISLTATDSDGQRTVVTRDVFVGDRIYIPLVIRWVRPGD